MTRAASTRAPAKVNLLLRVLGRRADGFHDLETIFQTIDIHDEVVVDVGGKGVDLVVDGPDLGATEDNLAYRAAKAFLNAAGRDDGLRIRLTKRIAAGAGLGGGSSDGAAVLRLLGHLFPGEVSVESVDRIAATLGSDVPFFLCGSPLALARGRGEVLTALPALPSCAMYVVAPPVHVATGEAYRALAASRAHGWRPEAGSLAEASPATWADVRRIAHNDFEPVIAERHPEVARALEVLRDGGHPTVMLSGSGGACFALDPSAEAAAVAVPSSVAALGWEAHACRTLTSVPEIVDL